MASLMPLSPRPSPRTSPRVSPRPALRPSPRSTHSGSLPGTPKSSSGLTLSTSATARGRASNFNKLLKNAQAAHRDADAVKEDLKRLRGMILADGIPAEMDPTLRPRIWKILLQVGKIDGDEYLNLVRRGPCRLSEKIRNDTFRTFASNRVFTERVREGMLVRLLDAFVWHNDEHHELNIGYVQGMNALVAPFLFIMPSEVEAFYAFCTFIEHCCPQYVQNNLDGVHRGVDLLERCLEHLDPELYTHLHSKGLVAKIYAFPSVLTLCACTPPLNQVLQLWDFLLAYGVHLNILCVIAQMMVIRQDLLSSERPNTLLRKFPEFNAKEVCAIALTLVRDIPDELYEELVRHPWEKV